MCQKGKQLERNLFLPSTTGAFFILETEIKLSVQCKNSTQLLVSLNSSIKFYSLCACACVCVAGVAFLLE